jgi:hypothetical protein
MPRGKKTKMIIDDDDSSVDSNGNIRGLIDYEYNSASDSDYEDDVIMAEPGICLTKVPPRKKYHRSAKDKANKLIKETLELSENLRNVSLSINKKLNEHDAANSKHATLTKLPVKKRAKTEPVVTKRKVEEDGSEDESEEDCEDECDFDDDSDAMECEEEEDVMNRLLFNGALDGIETLVHCLVVSGAIKSSEDPLVNAALEMALASVGIQ